MEDEDFTPESFLDTKTTQLIKQHITTIPQDIEEFILEELLE